MKSKHRRFFARGTSQTNISRKGTDLQLYCFFNNSYFIIAWFIYWYRNIQLHLVIVMVIKEGFNDSQPKGLCGTSEWLSVLLLLSNFCWSFPVMLDLNVDGSFKYLIQLKGSIFLNRHSTKARFNLLSQVHY